jgi:gliding motility-associated-like protein
MRVKILLSFFLPAVLSVHTVKSQSLVNTTGNTISNNYISIEYSIGEIAITTLSSNDNYVTQGLLQPIIKAGVDPCIMLDFIPNAFTPNNDGLNDCYGVKNWPFVNSFELSIFDRWGVLVFKTNDIYACWDGTYRGKVQPIGAYVYMIRSKTSCGPAFRKGTFILTR